MFINWSDPDEMLTLLVEYVEDELAQTDHDRDRKEFLVNLLEELRAIEDSAAGAPPATTIAALRTVSDTQPSDFASDPVLVHLNECIVELARIAAGSTPVDRVRV